METTLRSLLALSLLLLMCSGVCAGADVKRRERPLFGVIRWDMYTGHPRVTQQQEFGFLKPAQWQWRAPFFVRRTGDPENPLFFNPSYSEEVVQEITDQEIIYASSCGIDYFAFGYSGLLHKPDYENEFGTNLTAYRNSRYKSRINFCVIAPLGSVGIYSLSELFSKKKFEPTELIEDWHGYVKDFIELMREPTYQRVLGNRPIIYFLDLEGLIPKLGDTKDSLAHTKEAFQYFRDQAVAAGVGNPYIVDWIAPDNALARKCIAEGIIDALNPYHFRNRGTPDGRPYAKLWNDIVEDYLAKTGDLKVVPPLMSGADWEPRVKDMPTVFPALYYDEPEPGELGRHLTSGLDYVDEHPRNCDANSVLMYAWNEHSEGGFLCPLMGDPPDYKPVTRQIDEVSRALKNWTRPASRESDGVVLANYSFGDREGTSESIDNEPDSIVTMIELPPYAYFVPVNNQLDGCMGYSAQYHLRQSAADVFEFRIKPRVPSAKMDLKRLEMALCLASGDQKVDVVFWTKLGGAKFKRVGEVSVSGSGESGWHAVSFGFPASYEGISAETTVRFEVRGGPVGASIMVDDIRVRGHIHVLKKSAKAEATGQAERPLRRRDAKPKGELLARFNFGEKSATTEPLVSKDFKGSIKMKLPASAEIVAVDEQSNEKRGFAVKAGLTASDDDFFVIDVAPIGSSGHAKLAAIGLSVKRDTDSSQVIARVQAKFGDSEFRDLSILVFYMMSRFETASKTGWEERWLTIPDHLSDMSKPMTIRFRMELGTPGSTVLLDDLQLLSRVECPKETPAQR